jgi:hypothetical protein
MDVMGQERPPVLREPTLRLGFPQGGMRRDELVLRLPEPPDVDGIAAAAGNERVKRRQLLGELVAAECRQIPHLSTLTPVAAASPRESPAHSQSTHSRSECSG